MLCFSFFYSKEKKNNQVPSMPSNGITPIASGDCAAENAILMQIPPRKVTSTPIAKVSSRSFLWAAVGASVSYLGIVAFSLICLAAFHPVGLAAIAVAGFSKAMIPSMFCYKAMAVGSVVGFGAGSMFDQPESDSKVSVRY